MLKFKYGKIPSYSYQLVESDFEIMSSKQLIKKSENSSQNTHGLGELSSNESTSPNKTTRLINNTVELNPFNFTIPIDDIKLDKDFVHAKETMKQVNEESEFAMAKAKVEDLEAIAENQAIFEIHLNHPLLLQNVEIVIYSKHMSKSIFDKLTQNTIPFYLYGIFDNKLTNQVIFLFKILIISLKRREYLGEKMFKNKKMRF